MRNSKGALAYFDSDSRADGSEVLLREAPSHLSLDTGSDPKTKRVPAPVPIRGRTARSRAPLPPRRAALRVRAERVPSSAGPERVSARLAIGKIRTREDPQSDRYDAGNIRRRGCSKVRAPRDDQSRSHSSSFSRSSTYAWRSNWVSSSSKSRCGSNSSAEILYR